ncbi:MAG TPA: metal-dependent transcriptional regulator [Caldilineales bacterium]|nr:metal-dependent transcriptional regulator [Caldilineales bacterium]
MSDPMTEAAEMYLLRIALLSEGEEPVPISQLAETLHVSPISANQMCRKLESRGLVDYQPYKGVTLTLQGEAIALRMLRKRRLWEVFLAEKLGLDPQDAEDVACRFEHVTPEDLAERLADYLGNPTLSPQRQPIPPRFGGVQRRMTLRPLAAVGVGARVQVTNILTDATTKAFLRDQGIGPGAIVTILASAPEKALLVAVDGQRVSLAADIAQKIDVTPLDEARPEAPLHDVQAPRQARAS